MVAERSKAGTATGYPGGADALRTVEIQVPHRTQTGFAAECRRQAPAVAAADTRDPGLEAFMDEVLADLDDGTE